MDRDSILDYVELLYDVQLGADTYADAATSTPYPQAVVTLDDVPTMLDVGFEFGSSGETLWLRGQDGEMYCAFLSTPGQGLKWYTQRESGGLDVKGVMKRAEFRELFYPREASVVLEAGRC